MALLRERRSRRIVHVSCRVQEQLMTNKINAGSASLIAVTAGEGLIGGRGRGTSFSLWKGVWGEVQYARNCPHPLHLGSSAWARSSGRRCYIRVSFRSTRYPLLLGAQRQYGMRSLPDTSTHDQQWESNPRPSDHVQCPIHLATQCLNQTHTMHFYKYSIHFMVLLPCCSYFAYISYISVFLTGQRSNPLKG